MCLYVHVFFSISQFTNNFYFFIFMHNSINHVSSSVDHNFSTNTGLLSKITYYVCQLYIIFNFFNSHGSSSDTPKI